MTSFTLAHSITLIAAAHSLVPSGRWFPSLVETLIAASILYMAIENVAGPRLSHRWILAFAFGLVHGFGFAFALRESLQFAGAHLLLSLFSFNLGIELGQILAIALLVPALTFFFRRILAERTGTILLSVIVAHSAWHWMIERARELRRHAIPISDIPILPVWGGGLALLLLVLGSVWLLAHRWRQATYRRIIANQKQESRFILLSFWKTACSLLMAQVTSGFARVREEPKRIHRSIGAAIKNPLSIKKQSNSANSGSGKSGESDPELLKSL